MEKRGKEKLSVVICGGEDKVYLFSYGYTVERAGAASSSGLLPQSVLE